MTQLANVPIPVPMLFGGVSSQPPQVRFPNQVSQADNIMFSVVRGVTRRSGSWLVAHVCDGILEEDGDYRMLGIERDSLERYIFIFGGAGSGAVIIGFDLINEEWVTVDISATAQTYIDTGNSTAEHFSTLSIVDFTYFANSRVNLVGTDGPNPGDATIDATKMPMQMKRLNLGGSGTITGNTVANPTVVTSVAHGRVTGETLTFAGTNSTPSIDGQQQITVTGPDTFTVPVNVTVAGNSGTWTAPAYFKIDVGTWPARTTGSNVSNPLPRPWAQGRVIRAMAYWERRLGIACGELLMFTEADNLNNWFQVDATNIVNSDPIDSQVSSNQLCVIDYMVLCDNTLQIFTKVGQQFSAEVEGDSGLSVETLKIKPTTNASDMFRAMPCTSGRTIWFGVEMSFHAHLLAYTLDDIEQPTEAEDVSAHVDRYIYLYENPSTQRRSRIRTIRECGKADVVLMLREDRLTAGDAGEVRSNKVYIYQYHKTGNQRVQTAWSVAIFGGANMGIHDIVVMGPWCYNLECHGGKFFLTRWSVPPESDGARVFNPTECS